MTSHYSEQNPASLPWFITGTCVNSGTFWFVPLSSLSTLLKTYQPLFGAVNFPTMFPFQRLCACCFFCLELHQISMSCTSLALSFQRQCSHLRFPFQLPNLEAAPPLLSVILLYSIDVRVPEIILSMHLLVYSLLYLPLLRCKLLTGRNSGLITTISPHLERSLAQSRFLKKSH